MGGTGAPSDIAPTTEAEQASSATGLTPLIATKLDPPLASSWAMPRHQLIGRLSDDSARLCLISAPGGWVKTSLMWQASDLTSGRRPDRRPT
jgi:ATP/maltotriose-dependent transcriptional regulator MalT